MAFLEMVPVVGPILGKVIGVPLAWLLSQPHELGLEIVQMVVCASCGGN